MCLASRYKLIHLLDQFIVFSAFQPASSSPSPVRVGVSHGANTSPPQLALDSPPPRRSFQSESVARLRASYVQLYAPTLLISYSLFTYLSVSSQPLSQRPATLSAKQTANNWRSCAAPADRRGAVDRPIATGRGLGLSVYILAFAPTRERARAGLSRDCFGSTFIPFLLCWRVRVDCARKCSSE